MKYTVGKFVEVMSGGLVLTDKVEIEIRSKAKASASRLEELKALLKQKSVPCRELNEMIEAYYSESSKASRESDAKQQRKHYEAIAAKGKADVAAAEVFVASYMSQAETLGKFSAEFITQFQAAQPRLNTLKRANLRTLLLDDANALRQRLDAHLTVGDASELAALLNKWGKFQYEAIYFDSSITEAADIDRISDELTASIQAKLAKLATLPRANAQLMGRRVLTALQTRQADAEIVPDASQLSNRMTALEIIQRDLNDMSAELSPATTHRVGRADKKLKQIAAQIKDLPTDELRDAATRALKTFDSTLDWATLGLKETGNAYAVNVGLPGKHKKLKASELIRALDTSLAGFGVALSDPKSLERQLLEAEGPEQFAEGLTRMNTIVIAFGANYRNISPAEALAIHRYTGTEYSDMNAQRLGLKTDARLALLNKTCDEALVKLPPYPKEAWPVFRAERAWSQDVVDKRYATGNTFVNGVLWSTGAKGEVDLSTGSPRFRHIIYGTSGRDVAAMSATPGEGAIEQEGFEPHPLSGRGEVLFTSTTSFTVTDRTDPPGGREALIFDAKVKYKAPIVKTRLKEV